MLLDQRTALDPARGLWLADLGRGVREVRRALFALLHHRTFLGQLRLPVWANAIACSLLGALVYFVLWPWFQAAFAATWWFGDGWRASQASRGAVLWVVTTWLVLGPPLLELLAGALQEGLHDAAERAMLGEGTSTAGAAPRGTMARLRDRAQVAAAALLLWPVALSLVLLPWVGLPLVALLGAAIAAAVWFELPMARRGLDLRQRLVLLWRNRWRALGVGAGVQLAAGVPFLNLLGLAPVATVAACSAFLQFEKRR